MQEERKSMWRRRVKRMLDLLIALVALIVLAPVIGIVMVVIRLVMGSPVIFRQRRAGMFGRPFDMLKFRTMSDARDDQGQLLPDEQRLTRLGAFLRRTSLDELPQLWSVLKGDMSLIGPRPLPVEYLPLYTPDQYRRHTVPAGIVGWASVCGRNLNTWEKKFELDLWYVDNWSLLLDLRIMLKAVPTAISGSGVSAEGAATCSKFTNVNGPEKAD
jgi:lipopolysaccharide/colanic/teichoic acid biosynthesis glycosyltransferase